MSGKCEGSNLQVKRNDSFPFMDSSKTSSALVANCYGLVIIESYEVARSSLGTPSRAPPDSSRDDNPAVPACSRNVNLTVRSAVTYSHSRYLRMIGAYNSASCGLAPVLARWYQRTAP